MVAMTLSHLDNSDNDSRVMTRDHVTQPQSCRHIQTEKILSLLAREPWRESKQSAPVILGYDTPTIGERRERDMSCYTDSVTQCLPLPDAAAALLVDRQII